MRSIFSSFEYASEKRFARHDWFLSEVGAVTPSLVLVAEIEPVYPNGGSRRCFGIGVKKALWLFMAQQHFGLTDEGIQDAIYESQAIRGFIGFDLSRATAFDATALLKFLCLVENSNTTERLFTTINIALGATGLLLRADTVVDATFSTAAKVSKIIQTQVLLRGDESAPFCDSDYLGVRKSQKNQSRSVNRNVVSRLGKRRPPPKTTTGQLRKQSERLKAKARTKVENPSHVVKNIFGRKKASYCGLTKYAAQPQSLFGLANLMFTKRCLFELKAQGAF